jgi:hypothetical protein
MGQSYRLHGHAQRPVPLDFMLEVIPMIITSAHARNSIKAIDALKPFLNVMRHRVPGADRFADASADAMTELVQSP